MDTMLARQQQFCGHSRFYFVTLDAELAVITTDNPH
jgi:hypothetical protein